MKTACASSLVVSVLILSREQIETCLSHSSLFSGEKKSMKGCLPEQDVLELLMHVHVHMKLTVGINHHTTTCFINDPREANSSHMIQF